MHSQDVQFTGASGARLSGILDLPRDGSPTAYALFAHCFTCSKNFKATTHISRSLAAEGIAVLRFDFEGLGQSEGEFADTTFSSNVSDLIAASEFLGNRYGAPSVLIGHSLGGTAVLHAARQIPTTRAVVTIGAPADPSHVTQHFNEVMKDIEADGKARVSLAGRDFTITRNFVDDLRQVPWYPTIHELNRPLLIFHSPLDRTVDLDNAARIYQAAVHPKSFVSLDRSDHLLSNPHDSLYVGKVIAAWVHRYLELPDHEAPAYTPEVVCRTEDTPYHTRVGIRDHLISADEPRNLGGGDTGPMPYELLAAALGTCTTITLQMYARRNGWALEAATARVSRETVREGKSERVRLVTRVQLDGNLDPKQRRRLALVTERCPVHKTLKEGVFLETRVEEVE